MTLTARSLTTHEMAAEAALSRLQRRWAREGKVPFDAQLDVVAALLPVMLDMAVTDTADIFAELPPPSIVADASPLGLLAQAVLGPAIRSRLAMRAGAIADELQKGYTPATVARNEVAGIRTVATSAVATYAAPYVTAEAVWHSSPDCVHEACLSMNGERVAYGQPFSNGASAPPVHPNCLVGGTIVAGPPVVGTYAREYSGVGVLVHTATNRRLTVTPHHPLLTPQGWVPAGEIDVGDDLVCYDGVDSGLGDPDDEQVPARIEKVVSAFRVAGGVNTCTVPAAAEYLHGDGLGSEIDIVRADRLLGDDGQPTFCQPDLNEQLGRGAGRGVLPLSGGSAQGLHGPSRSSDGGMSGGSVATMELGSELLGPEQVGLLHGASSGPALVQDPRDDRPADPEFVRQCLLRRTGEVTTDHVVSVEIVALAHERVYNLETIEGWYTGNGIVVANCRCRSALEITPLSVTAAGDVKEPVTDSIGSSHLTAAADGPGWLAVVAIEGLETPDHRMVERGGLGWRTLPLPLTWSPHSDDHEDDVVVGQILEVWREGDEVRARGNWDTSPEAIEVRRKVDGQMLRWVSMCPDTPRSWEVRMSPGCDEAEEGIDPTEDGPPVGRDLGACVMTEVYLDMDFAKLTVVDHPAWPGSVIVPGDAEIPALTDRGRVAAAPIPAEVVALAACAAVVAPPASWFDDPGLTAVTPITITDEGYIHGHFAPDVDHIAGHGRPPRGTDYDSAFHLHAQPTAEGHSVKVGLVIGGVGHPNDVPRSLSVAEAQRYYAGPGAIVTARVRVGEDAHGVWMAGAVAPDLDDSERAQLRALKFSGDWRRKKGTIQWSLVAIASGILVPGYPDGQSLVAAGSETCLLLASS